MKKFLILFSLIVLFYTSCDELDQFTMFDIDYSQSFDIPPIPVANVPVEIVTPPIATHSDSIFQAYNTNGNLIEEATLKEMRLVISSRAGGDFKFLKSISFFLQSDTLPEQEVAWNYDVPENASDTLLLETTENDLRLFILQDTLKLKMSILTDSPTSVDYKIKADMIFHIDAKILGL